MTFLDGNVFGDPFTLFLFQLSLITMVCQGLGKFLKKVKQPMVIAEMLSGILLGPSVLGNIPGFSDTFFPASSYDLFKSVANLGLVIFMFLIGLEMDQDLLQSNGVRYVSTAIIGVGVPFICSIPVSYLLFNSGAGWVIPEQNFVVFVMFVGLGMGFSALPVLGRILTEKGLLHKELGVFSLATSAMEDIMGWILLAVIITIARASSALHILYTALLALSNLLILAFAVRRVFVFISKRVDITHRFNNGQFFVVLVITMMFSWLVEECGLSAILGGFGVGCVMPRNRIIVSNLTGKLRDVMVILFLPLYFTLSGLRTNVGLIDSWAAWGVCLLVIVVEFTSKSLAEGLCARFIGKLSVIDSVVFGIFMQTKGLVALVVFNLGIDYGVITPKFFSVAVIMVLFSTVITSPLVELIFRRRGLDVPSGGLSVLLCALNSHSAKLMVSFIQPLVENRPRGTTFLTAINIITPEFDNSMLSSWVYMRENYFGEVLHAARAQARTLGIKVNTATIMAEEDDGREICRMASQQKSSLILLSRDAAQEHFEKASTITYVLQHMKDSDVGIFINQPKSPDSINSVLVPLIDGQINSASVKYAKLLAQGEEISITLLHIVKSQTAVDVDELNSIMELTKDSTNLKYLSVETEDLVSSVSAEIYAKRYSLLMLDYVQDATHNLLYYDSPCDVLLLHAATEQSTTVEISERMVQLDME